MTSELNSFLEKSRRRICGHMNGEHNSSVKAYARYYGKMTDLKEAQMIDVELTGFKLKVTNRDGSIVLCLVPFPKTLISADQIHKYAIDMHKEAFNGLGFMYRVSNGYYITPIKRIGKGILRRGKQISWVLISIMLAGALGMYFSNY